MEQEIKQIEIKTIEVSGFASAIKAVRLSYNKSEFSEILTQSNIKTLKDDKHNQPVEGGFDVLQYGAIINVDKRDIELLSKLVKTGDEHAKCLRGIIAYAEITAPIYWWYDLETYRVGHERLMSESTMHTECKALRGAEIQKVKGEIPFGHMHKKVDYFSYQTLRRILFQRHNHRLPEFAQFIEWMKTLPYADELIFVGFDDYLFRLKHKKEIDEFVEQLKKAEQDQ